MLGQDGGSVRVSGAPVEKEVVDTTGAGDAFVGSLAFFLACRCLLSHPMSPMSPPLSPQPPLLIIDYKGQTCLLRRPFEGAAALLL